MPHASPGRHAVVRFGPFALDLRSGELSRDEVRTRLQGQSFEFLRCLIEHPGRLVTRDELRRRLWPNGTIVDFEHGVNTALKRLRDALGDEAEHPVYIETVPRRGYRFIAAVEVVSVRDDGPVAPQEDHAGRPAAPGPGDGFVSSSPAGSYRVLEQIGAGGMGEVYRAEDLVLKREVALKVLPAAFASDPDRLARFRREAEALATLNHPHICTLHAMGDAQPGELGVAPDNDGTGARPVARPYLVMEHIDGQTLAARLEKGPLSPVLVCELGAQIADALAAAHRHGVIHRDLKPANIMLTRTSSGHAGVPHAKLLDFGLAKLAGHGERPAIAFDSAAETQRTPLTGQGAIVGTLPYMAPEQVEGKEADARTDIWALGTVLYEMATGKPAFAADSYASLAGRILTAEPAPISTHQSLTPPALEHAVSTCLAKDPEARWQSASDVARELRWIAEEIRQGRTPAGAGPSDAVTAARRARRWRTTAVATLCIAIAATAGAVWMWRSAASTPALAHPSLDVGPAEEINAGGQIPSEIRTAGGSRTALAWTPDGQALIFVGRRGGVQQLYVRRLDTDEARPLAGTEGAQTLAVSPDGRWVAFWSDRAIRKVPIDGGPVSVLAPGTSSIPWGLAWNSSGGVYFAMEWRPVREISADGTTRPVTALREGERTHAFPALLPGGQVLMYTVRRRNWTWGDEEIVVQDMATGARTVLLKDGTDARYVPTGHLVFMRRGQLFAVPFDPKRLKLGGAPVAVVDMVAQALTAGLSSDATGAGQFAVSSRGALAWLPGPVVSYREGKLVSIDRRGKVSTLAAPARSYLAPRLSPDGSSMAVTIRSHTELGLWIVDRDRGALFPVLRDGEADFPRWSPDGRRVLFRWIKDGRPALAVQVLDDGGTTVPRIVAAGDFRPSSTTPDGRDVAVASGGDIAIVRLDDEPASVRWLTRTSQTEGWPVFSPDGRWLAYGSNASGRNDVYVQPYPGPGAPVPVSLEGGSNPAWNPNGLELFFLSNPDADTNMRMLAVDFTAGSPPRIGRPRVLFENRAGDPALSCRPVTCYGVAPDGEGFYAVQFPPPLPLSVVTHISLNPNFLEELKAKMRVK
jgi:serine/threonine-protein kinase